MNILLFMCYVCLCALGFKRGMFSFAPGIGRLSRREGGSGQRGVTRHCRQSEAWRHDVALDWGRGTPGAGSEQKGRTGRVYDSGVVGKFFVSSAKTPPSHLHPMGKPVFVWLLEPGTFHRVFEWGVLCCVEVCCAQWWM